MPVPQWTRHQETANVEGGCFLCAHHTQPAGTVPALCATFGMAQFPNALIQSAWTHSGRCCSLGAQSSPRCNSGMGSTGVALGGSCFWDMVLHPQSVGRICQLPSKNCVQKMPMPNPLHHALHVSCGVFKASRLYKQGCPPTVVLRLGGRVGWRPCHANSAVYTDGAVALYFSVLPASHQMARIALPCRRPTPDLRRSLSGPLCTTSSRGSLLQILPLGECLPGACPARYLCNKYPISRGSLWAARYF